VVHLAPITPRRRRLDFVAGGFLAVLGVAVAVLAIVALGQPKGHQASQAKNSVAVTSHAATTPPTNASSPATSVSASTTPSSKSSSSASSTASTAGTGVKSVPLIVLNSTTQTGLAASAAKTFSSGGWTVTSSGNIVNNILSTCAYYDPSDPQNQVAAEALMAQFPAIKRVVAKFSGLPAGPIVVVLTSDYS
jgi:hypothetical protein